MLKKGLPTNQAAALNAVPPEKHREDPIEEAVLAEMLSVKCSRLLALPADNLLPCHFSRRATSLSTAVNVSNKTDAIAFKPINSRTEPLRDTLGGFYF